MSDGQANYPEEEINNFKKELLFKEVIDFQAIYFGSSSPPETLVQMA